MHYLHKKTGLCLLLLVSQAFGRSIVEDEGPVEVVVTADGRALPGEAAYGTPKEAAEDPLLRSEPPADPPLEGKEALSVADKFFNAIKGSASGRPTQALPKEKVVRVISDTHAGGCWFRDKVNQKKLMTFFENMASGEDLQSLDSIVLNGDILELGLENLGTKPKCPSEIFSSQNEEGFDIKRFNSLIRRISLHIPTYFVVGNHDIIMEKELVKEAWGDKVKFMGNDFSMHGICFTHGHLQDIASHAPEGSGLGALAYYVSRATTTPEDSSCETGKGFAMRPGWQVHAAENIWGVAMNQLNGKLGDDAITFLAKPENYEKFAISLLSSALKLKKHDKEELAKYTVSGANKYGPNCQGLENSNYTLADVVDDHREDMQLAMYKYGKNQTVRMWRSTMMDYAAWASTQCMQDCKAQLVGHSHVPELKKVPCTYHRSSETKQQKEIMYGNSGAWTWGPFEQRLSSYIDITVSCEGADAQFTEFERPGVRRETQAQAQICEPTRLDLFQYNLDRDPELIESITANDEDDGSNMLTETAKRLKTLIEASAKMGEDQTIT